MIGALLALLLAASDAGFSPVVLDVHHGELWLTAADGGADDTPTLVTGGAFMDTETTEWLAGNKARTRAERAVFSSDLPSARLLAWAFGGGALFGLVGGFVLGWWLLH